MIVGIEGNLGNGKTATMARMGIHYNGLCSECNGVIDYGAIIPILFDEYDIHECTCKNPHPYKIHANFWIDGISDFHYVTCLEDVEKIYQGVFLADEFWSWVDCRNSRDEDSNIVSGTMLTSRKRGYNLIFESKLMHMTDKRIRHLTDYVLRPNKYIEIDGELTKIEQHMLYPINMAPYKDKTYIIVDELSGMGLTEVQENLFQFKLSEVADRYNTREEIKKLGEGEKCAGIEKGIKIETNFIKALKDSGATCEIVQGIASRGWDVILNDPKEKQSFDVVSVQLRKGMKQPTIDLRRKKIKSLLDSAKKGKMTPYWAYQWNGKWWKLPMLESHTIRTTLTCRDAIEIKKEGE